MEKISSNQNLKIKNIVKLLDAKQRREQNRILIEGEREIFLAVSSGIEIETLFYCAELAKGEYDVLHKISEKNVFVVTPDVFTKIAYREHPDGFLAVAVPKNINLSDVVLKKDPLIIVLEKVEKPGNLGAILRTADAAQADAILICEPRTDIFNPNVIRASMGTVFANQVVACTNEEALSWLAENRIKSYSAALTAKMDYIDVDWREGAAIVLGTEYEGLSDFWLKNCVAQIKIPMAGKIDSLNVSNTAAILVFEALRQRR